DLTVCDCRGGGCRGFAKVWWRCPSRACASRARLDRPGGRTGRCGLSRKRSTGAVYARFLPGAPTATDRPSVAVCVFWGVVYRVVGRVAPHGPLRRHCDPVLSVVITLRPIHGRRLRAVVGPPSTATTPTRCRRGRAQWPFPQVIKLRTP